MYKFYNANPKGRRVNDYTVRAYSLAKGISWDEAYEELSYYAQQEAIMPDEVKYIDGFLSQKYKRVCGCHGEGMTVHEFMRQYPYGVYLITMNGHITCVIDGCVYDTFDPSDRLVWDAYIIK